MALACAGATAAAALGAAGDLDPAFNATGKVALPSPGNDDARDVVLQPDGKIVVAGSTTSNLDAMVWRYNPNGTPDTSFNPMGTTPGQVAIDAGGDDSTEAIALAPNGKIVGVGQTSIGGDSLIYQLNSNGTPDTGFGGGDGHLEIDTPLVSFAFRGVAVQPDNNIVAVGGVGAQTYVFRRDGTTGGPDNTCDMDGVMVFSVGGTAGGADVVDLQVNGDIVVAGETDSGPTPDNGFVARLLGSNCSLDTGGFNNPTGFAILDSLEIANGVTIAPDQRIVVVGPHSGNGVVYRLTTTGAFDTSFDTDGTAGIDSGGSENLRDVAVQPDGKIVTVGSSTVGPDAVVYRLTVIGGPGPLNGAFDTSFAGDGAIGVDNGGTTVDAAHGVALQPDGKVVAAGRAATPAPESGFLFRLEGDSSPVQIPQVAPIVQPAPPTAAAKKCKKGRKLVRKKGKLKCRKRKRKKK